MGRACFDEYFSEIEIDDLGSTELEAGWRQVKPARQMNRVKNRVMRYSAVKRLRITRNASDLETTWSIFPDHRLMALNINS